MKKEKIGKRFFKLFIAWVLILVLFSQGIFPAGTVFAADNEIPLLPPPQSENSDETKDPDIQHPLESTSGIDDGGLDEKVETAPIISNIEDTDQEPISQDPSFSTRAVTQQATANNFSTLKSVVASAPTNGTVLFIQITGNISFTGTLIIPANTTITISSDSSDNTRVFNRASGFTGMMISVSAGSTLQLNDSYGESGLLNIDGGADSGVKATGSLISNSGNLYIQPKVNLMKNASSSSGSALFNTATGNVYSKGGFSYNSSATRGGAIYNKGYFEQNINQVVNASGKLITVSGHNDNMYNTAVSGGGWAFNLGTMIINEGSFHHNSCTGAGGFIYSYGYSPPNPEAKTIINGGLFYNNSSNENGSVYYQDKTSTGTATFIHSGGSVYDNMTGKYAFYIASGTATIQDNAQVGLTASKADGNNNGNIFISSGATGTIQTTKETEGPILRQTTGTNISNSGTLYLQKLTESNSHPIIDGKGTSKSIGATYGIYNNGWLYFQKNPSDTDEVFDTEIFGNIHAIYNAKSLYLSSGYLHDNTNGITATGSTTEIGGGIISHNSEFGIDSSSSVSIKDGVISENKTGISCKGSVFTMSGGTISKHTQGGILLPSSSVNCEISGGNILDNTSDSNGAGISSIGYLKITGGVISGNVSQKDGGGIYYAPPSAGILNVEQCVLQNNHAGQDGGGIYFNGLLSLSSSDVSNNIAERNGGGIYIAPHFKRSISILDCHIDDNKALDGGGIYVVGEGTSQTQIGVSNTTIDRNIASSDGGGVYLTGGYVYFLLNSANNSISFNSASMNGGGIYIEPENIVYLSDGVYKDNTAQKGQGIYQDGDLYMSSLAKVDVNNDIYVLKPITVNGELSKDTDTYALLTPSEYYEGNVMVNVSYDSAKGSTVLYEDNTLQKKKWELTPSNRFYLESTDLIDTIEAENQIVLLESPIPPWAYVDGVKGNDSNDGLTPKTAVKTFLQAYKNIQEVGGTIYVVGAVVINETITMSDTKYTGKETVSLAVGKKVEIRRYSQPVTVTEGFEVASFTGRLITIGAKGDLTIENIVIDGHRNAITESSNPNAIANGVKAKNELIWNKGQLRIKEGSFIQNNNITVTYGGGIRNDGTFLLEGGTITNNSDSNSGGGISNTGLFTMKTGVISNNTAGFYGAGIFNIGGTFIMEGGTILDNTAADGSGGGISNYQGGTVYLKDGFITNNTAYYGGGVWNLESTLTVEGSTITYNDAGYGGGICNENGLFTIKNATITHNTASEKGGGGIYNEGDFSIENCLIAENASDYGGGIYNLGIFEFKNGIVAHNKALTGHGEGGGVYNDIDSTFILQHGEICENEAINGGGVYNNIGTFTLNGGKIADNTAKFYGGGISNIGDIVLNAGEIVHNTSQSGGAIYNDVTGSIHIYDGVISENISEFGKGIFQDGILYMEGIARIDMNNEVYLPTGRFITVSNALTSELDALVYIIPQKYFNGCKIVEVAYDSKKASDEYHYSDGDLKFSLAPKKSFLLRPGDYLAAEANIAASDIIISSPYAITYDSNISETVQNMPEKQVKYWYENMKLSDLIPVSKNTFLGWNPDAGSKAPTFKPSDLYKDNSDITLFAIWKQIAPPTIEQTKKLEFYEGQKVTKDMLLDGIIAKDSTGNPLTDIEIIEIQYAAGKLVDGVKTTEGENVPFEKGMTDADYLDTWFLQLPKEDSPVEHHIIYRTTDSRGSSSTFKGNIFVKYNEVPVIHGEDRTFTSTEAQNGMITEDLLLSQAITDGLVTATDEEDDVWYPNVLSTEVRLLDFYPEEFAKFKEDGFVLLHYYVVDSLGKETIEEIRIEIYKDGEISSQKNKEVRFINWNFYKLNAEKDSSDYSEEELAEMNQNGGLHVDSKWYKNTVYSELLESVLKETYDEARSFPVSKKNIPKMKKFVGMHGIGNSQAPDSLKDFYDLYLNTNLY